MRSSLAGSAFLVVLLSVSGVFASGAARAAYELSPLPLWVETEASPTGSATHPQDDSIAEFDRVFLRVEDQISLLGDEPEHYTRVVVRLQGQSAISDYGSVQLPVATGFERLYLHGITLWRGGEAHDRLTNARITVLHREARLEEGLVDEIRTVLVVLEDLRVGDELDIAYSRTGINPGLGGLFARRLSIARQAPVLERMIRVHAPEVSFPYAREIGAPILRHRQHIADGIRTDHWHGDRLPAVIHDPEAPAWHEIEGHFELSAAADWREVAQWAAPLYRPVRPEGELAALVERLRREFADPERRLLAALRFVQDEIRYTGLSIDEHWYVPHAADRVLARRYGDCKDKTLLLLTLLDALGFRAEAVLVHSQLQAQIERLLPSPYAFDHVIVRVGFGEQWYWIDPTAELQRGRLAHLAQADFGFGLVLNGSSSGLTRMPDPQSDMPDVDIRETIDLRDPAGGLAETGTLIIVTEYRRRQADRVRRMFARGSRNEIGRSYLNFLLRYYDHVEQAGLPEWSDDEEGNRVIVTERYRLLRPWLPAADDRFESSYMLSLIHSYANPPVAPIRDAPLSLSHPVHVVQRIKVFLDSGWPKRVESHEYGGEHFSVDTRIELGPSSLLMTGRFRSHARHVEPGDVAEFAAGLIAARGSLGYTLTTSLEAATHDHQVDTAATPIQQIIRTMLTTQAPSPDE